MAKGHDIVLKNETKVQVKTTQRNIVGMGLNKQSYEHLIVIKIYDEGKYEVVFDGPGDIVTKGMSESVRLIKVNKLRELNKHSQRKILKTAK